MQKADLNNPTERKKLILAAVLVVIAIIFLWWAFVGFGGSSNQSTQRAVVGGGSPPPPSSRNPGNQIRNQAPSQGRMDPLDQLRPIVFPGSQGEVPESKRNIFAYNEKPVVSRDSTPTPTPTPTPPVLVTGVSPASVYARTGDFPLEVSGNKFSPELRVHLDGRELSTRYVGPQQLSAVVPASLIAVAGQRQVIVRSSDGRLYSNAAEFSVNAPPTPNYSYIGIYGTKHYVDIALLQDRSTRTLLNVQRGDVLSGRFRVTSISEKELVLTDTNLKIKHSLAMSADADKGLGPVARPTPKVDAEDDEP
jgi:hypothetical protein